MFVMFKMAKPVRTIARITWVSVISTPSYIYIIHAGVAEVNNYFIYYYPRDLFQFHPRHSAGSLC